MLSSAIRYWLGPYALQRLLGGRHPVLGAVKGGTLGAITPFCSMSTVPVLTGLLQARVPFSTVTAFLAASPLIDPMLIVVTAAVFGGGFAVGLVVVAFLGTVIAASLVRGDDFQRIFRLERLGLATAAASATGSSSGPPAGKFSAADNFLPRDDNRPTTAKAIARASARDAWRTVRALWLPLCVGLVVGALIDQFAPRELLISVLGRGDVFAVPIAAILGVPMAVNTATALPVALALLHKGAAFGPVFALVVGGWGAAVAEVGLLASLLKPRGVVLYLIWVFGAAIIGGYAVNAIH